MERLACHKHASTFCLVNFVCRISDMKITSEELTSENLATLSEVKIFLNFNSMIVVCHWRSIFLPEFAWYIFPTAVHHLESSCFPLFNTMLYKYFCNVDSPQEEHWFLQRCKSSAAGDCSLCWFLKVTCKEDFRIQCLSWKAATSTQKLWEMQFLPMAQDHNPQGIKNHFILNTMPQRLHQWHVYPVLV